MGTYFYILDIMIAVSLPIFFHAMHSLKRFPGSFIYMYWCGVFIGLTWELGFHFSGPEYSANPAFILLTKWPGPAISQPLLHSLWDGGLFMAGAGLVYIMCAPPHFKNFRWTELAVMVVWGMTSELAVEFLASGNMWVYTPQPWNPVLLKFRGADITLLPQLIWFFAPIVFYMAALKINLTASGRD